MLLQQETPQKLLVIEIKNRDKYIKMFLIEILFWCSLFVILYTYFGYPLILIGCSFFIKKKESKQILKNIPNISIILAAYNEEKTIFRKLDNCLTLDYPKEKIEILVGSDGSDDKTNDIVKTFEDKGVKLYAFSHRKGKMATVNRLVKNSTGEICVFSDISETFDQDAIQHLIKHFDDKEIGAVTGNHIYNKQKTGMGRGTLFYWRFQRLLQEIESRILTIFACDGTIYACRRKLFPFPPDDTINDDVAVPLGIIIQGKRIIFEPEAIARGDVLSDTKRFIKQKIRSQAGKYQNFLYTPSMFFPWPAKRWWIYISHSVLPVLIPWFLCTVILTNLLLFNKKLIYQVLMLGQCLFYLSAVIGYFAEKFKIHLPLVAIPFYFVTANIGSILGFFAFISGKQKSTWRKVE